MARYPPPLLLNSAPVPNFPVLPEFVFADVDVCVPGDRVAARHDTRFPKQIGVVEWLEHSEV